MAGEEQMIPRWASDLSREVGEVKVLVLNIEQRLCDGDDELNELDERVTCLETDKKALALGWKGLTVLITFTGTVGVGLFKVVEFLTERLK